MTMMMRRPESTVRVDALGAELRRLREACGLTLLQVAEQVGISQGHLSKMEAGKRTQQLEDVASLCTVYQVAGQERRDLLDLAKRSAEPGMWRPLVFRSRLATLRLLESRATALFSFETVLIPGHLQTIPYMQAVMRGGLIDDEEEIDRRVAARLQRQSTIRRRCTPMTAIVCESALRGQIGGAEVMAAQLRHLVEAVDRPNITMRVVPVSVGAHPGLNGPFIRLRFADRAGVVFVGCGNSSLFLEHPDDIESYKDITVELMRLALSPHDSVALTRSIAADLE